MGANLVVASKSDTMRECMSKMVSRDIRHLPVVDEDSSTVSYCLSCRVDTGLWQLPVTVYVSWHIMFSYYGIGGVKDRRMVQS